MRRVGKWRTSFNIENWRFKGWERPKVTVSFKIPETPVYCTAVEQRIGLPRLINQFSTGLGNRFLPNR
jgi:hypothetical protein